MVDRSLYVLYGLTSYQPNYEAADEAEMTLAEAGVKASRSKAPNLSVYHESGERTVIEVKKMLR